MVDWKTQRSPLLPAIPTESEMNEFARLVKWRRSMLDVISLFAANVYDDIRGCMSIEVTDSATINHTVTNQVLSSLVIPGNIYLDVLGAPIYSNGRLDANSSWHGLCPKMSGNALEYLSGTGIFSIPSGANGNGANHPAASVNDSATINFSIDAANQIISGVVIPGNIKLDDLGTPDDNTDLNASASRHGLLPKLSNLTNEFLAGDGTWAEPGGGANSNHAPVTVNDTTAIDLTITAGQLLTANLIPGNVQLDSLGQPANGTLLDANTGRHGLFPRLSGNSNEYLDGVGNWTEPAGGNNATCEAGSSITLFGYELTSEVGTWVEYQNANQYHNYYQLNTSSINLDARWSTVYLAEGSYRIEFLGCRGIGCGILQFMLGVTSLGTVDLYKSTDEFNFRHTINSVVISSANTYDFKLRVNSKNASSTGYRIPMTHVSIRRVA